MMLRMGSGWKGFGLPGVVLGVLLGWVASGRGPTAAAQARAAGEGQAAVRGGEAIRAQGARVLAGGDASGTLALVTSPTGVVQWLYLIDTKTRALAVYRVDPTDAKGVLKLEAARQYQWDLKLDHYNNQTPEPAAIEATVKALARTTQ